MIDELQINFVNITMIDLIYKLRFRTLLTFIFFFFFTATFNRESVRVR